MLSGNSPSMSLPDDLPILISSRTFTKIMLTRILGFTADYFRMLKKGERLDADEKSLGWVVCEDGKVSAALVGISTQ